ncbi:MAG: hypothetical protein ACKVOH_01185 [Chlamydiales bacterium]
MTSPIGGNPNTWGPGETGLNPNIGGDSKTWGPGSTGFDPIIGGDPNTWPPAENTAQITHMVVCLQDPNVHGSAENMQIAKDKIHAAIDVVYAGHPQQMHLHDVVEDTTLNLGGQSEKGIREEVMHLINLLPKA